MVTPKIYILERRENHHAAKPIMKKRKKRKSSDELSVENTDMEILVALTQPAFTRLKLTIETLEQGAKYVQS